MRRAHLVVGLASLVAFALTGQYMHFAHDHLDGMADGPRMLYRSAHIYLLFAAQANVLLGLYLRDVPAGPRRWLQRASSAAILIVPALFGAAFLIEPSLDGLLRPWARPAIYLTLAATVGHLLAARAHTPARPVGSPPVQAPESTPGGARASREREATR